MHRFLKVASAGCASAIAAIGLQAAPAFAAAPAHAAVRPALLVGELGIEGGAYPGSFRPTPGSVEVEFYAQPLVLEKKVGRSGQFKIRLGPGKYTVIGCGPSASARPSSQCSRPKTLTLAAGEVDYVQLVWAYVP
jgi:hypothetical protein